MLGLGVGFYKLGGEQGGSPWTPRKETSLEAWYKFGTASLVEGTFNWPDSSGNGFHMLQATEINQPSVSSGIVTFDGSDDLQSTGSIELTRALTIGIRLNTSNPTNVLLGDNLANQDLIKQVDSDTLRFKTSAGSGDIDLDGGNSFGNDHIVLTRDSSNSLKLWFNGVEQADGASRGGTSIINDIGNKFNHADDFVGDMYEIQIYSSTSAELTANVIARLSSL